MDARFVVGLLVGSLVIFLVLLFSGVIGFLVSFFVLNPLFLVSLVSLVVSLLAWRSGNFSFALIGLGVVLVSFTSDIFLPPYSAVCFSDSVTGLNFVQQFPLQAFASDSALCKLWIDVTNFNPVLFVFPNGVSFLVVLGFLLGLVLFFSLLSVLVNPRFWVASIFLIGLAFVLLVLFDSETFSGFSLTVASLFAYVFVPLITYFVGFWLLTNFGSWDGD